ncbi:MAG: hypothetical protein JSW66_12440 [Phycisphaerales bacterium]|nr:MAG: hypothetical protein JSW66_12440 [Phycisphaerales bacterium]
MVTEEIIAAHRSSASVIHVILGKETEYRALYADNILVAEDTQSGLGASGGGLYIGVGKDFAPGSFFSGLIDDVRIYSRALKPH